MKYFLPLIIAFSIFINPLNTLAEELILAGGCFWCLEHDLESLKGINFVQSGYSGGDLQILKRQLLKVKSISYSYYKVQTIELIISSAAL